MGEERQKRHAEREEKKREQEAKKGKVQDLKGKDPNAAEILRVKQWRKADDSKKAKTEAARVAKEIAQEQEQRNMQAEEKAREEKWEHLESVRKDREVERESARLEAVSQRAKAVPLGLGLPRILVF